MFFKALIAALFAFAPLAAHAVPAEVLIIRHAEKPDSVSDDEGRDLSPKGFQRADALVNVFTKDARMLDFGTPVAIYAGSPKKSTGSIRPLQTVQPTANALRITVNTSFLSKNFDDMVSDVLDRKEFANHTVLISWPHDEIVDMAHAFGVRNRDLPKKWKGAIFDRVWKIKFAADGSVTSFEDLPQRALPGDSQY